jgi:V/A-type H+-transporting ATPase subunit I
MTRLTLILLERDVEPVTEGLAEMGLMHVTQARSPENEGLLEAPDVTARLETCRQIRRRLEEFARQLALTLDPSAPVDFHEPFNLKEVNSHLDVIRRQLRRAEQSTSRARERIPELQAMLLELAPFRDVAMPLEELGDFNFLHFATGSLPNREVEPLQEDAGDRSVLVPYQTTEGREKLIAVSSKKNRWALETTLKEHGFRPEPLGDRYQGLALDVAEKLEEQLEQARKDAVRSDQAKAALREELGPNINQLWRRAAIEERLLEAQQRFGKTTSTYVITGWVPEEDLPGVETRVKELTGGRVMVETQSAEELIAKGVDVPSLMRHHWLLRPFQVLVSGYGFPRYNEVEPTIFVALSFLLMFGLMFGDVGHGGVFALIGYMVATRSSTRSMRDLGFVLFACGLSAVGFGFFYGSIFGNEELLPWGFRPMTHINQLMEFVLIFGMGMISLGLIINIINRIGERKLFESVMSQYGVVGFIFYWGAIGIAMRYFLEGAQAVSKGQVLLFLVLPMALLILREPIHHVLTREPATAGGILSAILEGLLDVMEAVMSFLSNTVSFIRVAAFALSHAGLVAVTFAMADMVRGVAGGTIWSWCILILGNAVIVVLEGMVVTIQTVRLEYYEFFSKFFSGEGHAFQPLSTSSEE